jgi:hypothetical protein
MAADERVAEGLQCPALGGGEVDRCPEGHEDRRVAGCGQPQEPAQRVERAVDVAGTRP